MKKLILIGFLLVTACAKDTKPTSAPSVPVSALTDHVKGCFLQSRQYYQWPFGMFDTETYFCPNRSPGCFIYLGFSGNGSPPILIKDECSSGGVIQKVSQ